MITKKQLTIFEPFTKNVYREYSIKEIKKESKEKSNNSVSIALKAFKEEDLVKERIVGKSKLYTLNVDNDLVFAYITLINRTKMPQFAHKSLEIIKEEIEKYTSFYTVAVFGSYATNEQKKNSDLDVAVFVENEAIKKKVKLALNAATLQSVISLDTHIFSELEFLEMLKVDYENVGKEIARKHLIIYNLSIFYSLLQKGAKNGFKL